MSGSMSTRAPFWNQIYTQQEQPNLNAQIQNMEWLAAVLQEKDLGIIGDQKLNKLNKSQEEYNTILQKKLMT